MSSGRIGQAHDSPVRSGAIQRIADAGTRMMKTASVAQRVWGVRGGRAGVPGAYRSELQNVHGRYGER